MEARKQRRADGRKYRVAAIGAAVLVVILALLVYDRSGARRLERYRRQATESYQSGDYDQALSDLRKAEAIQSSQENLMLMADCYEAQGNWDLALEVLRQMDLSDPVVTGRIAALEQRRMQEQEASKRIVAGESYDADTTELDLNSRGLGDGVLQELRQLYALSSLSLADNALQDLTPLGDLGALRNLDLSGNDIRDLTVLGRLSNLRSLTLDRNPLEDLSPLYALEELSLLSLRGVSLEPGALDALTEALPQCAILTDGKREGQLIICIHGVRFDAGATALDLRGLDLREIGFLSLCTQLKTLDLSDNQISDLSPLMELQQLEQLKLAGNQVSDLRPLIGMRSLLHVDVSRNAVTDTSAIGSVSTLITLNLSDNPIRDFSGLSKLSKLQTLLLENTGIGDEDLSALSGLRRLSRLTLNRNDGLTDEAVRKLKIAIPNCSVSHDALVVIISLGGEEFRSDETSLCIEGTELSNIYGFENFDRLETVRLGRNRIENLSVFQNSRSREKIRTLDLSYNRISDLSPLASMTALEELDLTGNNISSIRPLLRMTQLKTLRLGGNPLSEDQKDALRKALPDCDIEF